MTCFFLMNLDISSRYFLDEESRLQTFLEEDSLVTDGFQDLHASDSGLLWLPDTVKDFILPAGFPGDKHQFLFSLSLPDLMIFLYQLSIC